MRIRTRLSGGMGQRVMIAMMVSAGPRLLIADEPTSALDVLVSMQVLAVLDEMIEKHDTGLIFISHDLPLVMSFCDRVVVMVAGVWSRLARRATLRTRSIRIRAACSRPIRRWSIRRMNCRPCGAIRRGAERKRPLCILNLMPRDDRSPERPDPL